MKKGKWKGILLLIFLFFITGCSPDKEYWILKQTEVLDTRQFDSEIDEKMKTALEEGVFQKRYFRFEWIAKTVNDTVPEEKTKECIEEMKEGQVYLEITLDITNDMDEDQEWDIGNCRLFIPGTWETSHSPYEIRYFSEHPPLTDKKAYKEYNTWILKAHETRRVQVGYFIEESDFNNADLLFQISPYYFQRTDPNLGGMIGYYRVNEKTERGE